MANYNEAGLQITKAYLDQVAGNMAVAFRHWEQQVAAFQRGAAALTDADLTALGYSATGVTLIRAAVTNMVKIKNVATGAATQATAVDLSAALEAITGID